MTLVSRLTTLTVVLLMSTFSTARAGASASSCTYMAGAMMVLLTVHERGTPAEAAKD
jgi:hypothetical protein